MGGFYVPGNFSSNYVANKKNEDNTYVYDSAVNKAGIDAQRNLQQLNKQYNVTINNAYAQNLAANRGLRASSLGSGYKEAFAQNLQDSVNSEIEQVGLSVGGVKQSIFESLANSLSQIGGVQQQEINNMRRTASSLEEYHNYVGTLSKSVVTNNGNTSGPYVNGDAISYSRQNYTADQGFKSGDGYSFEDNYDKLFDARSDIISTYLDEEDRPGLSYEDWMRQNSTFNKDTDWLDWLYNGGLNQYKDFTKNGIK